MGGAGGRGGGGCCAPSNDGAHADIEGSRQRSSRYGSDGEPGEPSTRPEEQAAEAEEEQPIGPDETEIYNGPSPGPLAPDVSRLSNEIPEVLERSNELQGKDRFPEAGREPCGFETEADLHHDPESDGQEGQHACRQDGVFHSRCS